MFDFNDIDIENSAAYTIDYNLVALSNVMEDIRYPDSMNGIRGAVARTKDNMLVVTSGNGSYCNVWELFANTYIFYNDIAKLVDTIVFCKTRRGVIDISFREISNYVADHYNRYKKYMMSTGVKNVPGIAVLFCKMLDAFVEKVRYGHFIWNKNKTYQYQLTSTRCSEGRFEWALFNKKENVIKIISYIAAQPKHKFNMLLSNNVINTLMGILDEHGIGMPEGGYNVKTLTLKNFCDITYKAMIKANKTKKAKK